MHQHRAANRGISMRLFLSFFCAALVTTANLQPAHAQDTAIHLVTYVEITPDAADSGTTLFKQYRDTGAKEDGNLRFDVLREAGRPNRFVLVENWRDKAALDAHAQAAGTLVFRDKLDAIEATPQDERITSALYGGLGKSKTRGDAIYVVTHIDVVQAGVEECVTALKEMNADTARDPGNIGYEVLRQVNRPNHFTVVERWANRKALDAHTTAPHTRAFRGKLAPLQGALYDERIYEAL
jgi:quinol monooxygenase YgiN